MQEIKSRIIGSAGLWELLFSENSKIVLECIRKYRGIHMMYHINYTTTELGRNILTAITPCDKNHEDILYLPNDINREKFIFNGPHTYTDNELPMAITLATMELLCDSNDMDYDFQFDTNISGFTFRSGRTFRHMPNAIEVIKRYGGNHIYHTLLTMVKLLDTAKGPYDIKVMAFDLDVDRKLWLKHLNNYTNGFVKSESVEDKPNYNYVVEYNGMAVGAMETFEDYETDPRVYTLNHVTYLNDDVLELLLAKVECEIRLVDIIKFKLIRPTKETIEVVVGMGYVHIPETDTFQKTLKEK